jgi:biopolymer transport protein ExbB/TolQ
LWELILVASPFAKFILLLLAAMSVASWTVIIEKLIMMSRMKRANEGLSRYRWSSFDPRTLAAECRRFSAAPNSKAYIAVHREFIERGGDSLVLWPKS